MRFDTSLIIAERMEHGGYTWTLPSRLGEVLEIAEELFGPRDHSYTILGIDFTVDGPPTHWFPGGRKDAIIILPIYCASIEQIALMHLSHEAFHLLSPTGGRDDGTYFEEGMAEYFSLSYLERIGKPLRNRLSSSSPVSAKYDAAYNDVVALSKLYPRGIMETKIRDFRKSRGPTFCNMIRLIIKFTRAFLFKSKSKPSGLPSSSVSSMTDEEFKRIFPSAPDELRGRLLRGFYQG